MKVSTVYICLARKYDRVDWGDSSVGKELVWEAWEPKFKSLDPIAMNAYNSSNGKTGGRHTVANQIIQPIWGASRPGRDPVRQKRMTYICLLTSTHMNAHTQEKKKKKNMWRVPLRGSHGMPSAHVVSNYSLSGCGGNRDTRLFVGGRPLRSWALMMECLTPGSEHPADEDNWELLGWKTCYIG